MKKFWKWDFPPWLSLLILLCGTMNTSANYDSFPGSQRHSRNSRAVKLQVPASQSWPVRSSPKPAVDSYQSNMENVYSNGNRQPVGDHQGGFLETGHDENDASKKQYVVGNSAYHNNIDPKVKSTDYRRQPYDSSTHSFDSNSQSSDSNRQTFDSNSHSYDSRGQTFNSSRQPSGFNREIFDSREQTLDFNNQTFYSTSRPSNNATGNAFTPVEIQMDSLNTTVAPSETEVGERDLAAVTIAVMGRSGTGVSSTIRELIGPNSVCTETEGTESFVNIKEHIIEIPSSHESINKIRLIDIPGFVDGRTLEDESRILASLKSIIQKRGPPDFYLGLSKFDDNRYDGKDSLFVRFLKRVELFHEIFLNNTVRNISNNNSGESNIVFLLTHLMSETRSTQRRPERKINDFRRVIQHYTKFPYPILIVVGDNKAESEHGAKVQDGYYQLPNKQLYPKNIWETLIDASSNETVKNILTTLMDDREVEMKCETRLISTEWKHFEDDANAFQLLLRQTNNTIENTKVNMMIEDVFQQKNETEKMTSIVQKIALQLRLQQENVTNRDNLPRSLAERATFFQKDLIRSAPIPASLLQSAFGLQMPEYITPPLTVGYGYVLMEDEISPRTPFKTDISAPSPVGYQLPKFMKCKKLIRPEVQYFKSYSVNKTDYIQERLKYLDFLGKENTTESSFSGKNKEGFNMQPEEGDTLPTLTAVEERRILSCNLLSDWGELELEPEFIEEVSALNEFDKHKRDSVTELKNWFSKWGSHIVISGYGGGRLHGSIVGPNVRNVLESQTSIDDTLNSIVEFTPFTAENLGTPSYRLFGGGNDAPPSERLYGMEENERKGLIEQWEESLNSEFIMLTNEFRLEPISNFIKEKIGMEKGEIVEQAIELLLSGQLKFERRKKGNKGSAQANHENGNNGGGRKRKNGNKHSDANNRQEEEPRSGIPRQQNEFPASSTVSQNTWISTEIPTLLLGSASGNDSLDDFENLNITEAMQAQIEYHNTNILMLEKQMEAMKEKDNQQHRRMQEELDTMKAERLRWIERKKAELKKQQEDITITNNYYQNVLLNQEKNNELELELMRSHQEDMKRRNEEAERQHQLHMKTIKEEMKTERKKKNCSWWALDCIFGR